MCVVLLFDLAWLAPPLEVTQKCAEVTDLPFSLIVLVYAVSGSLPVEKSPPIGLVLAFFGYQYVHMVLLVLDVGKHGLVLLLPRLHLSDDELKGIFELCGKNSTVSS